MLKTRRFARSHADRPPAVGLGCAPEPRACEWPGCCQPGPFKAPQSRERLREFRWFCLEHVRAYNLQWNFFAGMSAPEIEAHMRADVTWHRPSWRFGTGWRPHETSFRDRFGDIGGDEPHEPRPARDPKAAEMMVVLDLRGTFTLVELKQRYKSLAKRHHPDLNNGDKAAEERLKLINEAYTYLVENRLYS